MLIVFPHFPRFPTCFPHVSVAYPTSAGAGMVLSDVLKHTFAFQSKTLREVANLPEVGHPDYLGSCNKVSKSFTI
jgi:hypothetical protein